MNGNTATEICELFARRFQDTFRRDVTDPDLIRTAHQFVPSTHAFRFSMKTRLKTLLTTFLRPLLNRCTNPFTVQNLRRLEQTSFPCVLESLMAGTHPQKGDKTAASNYRLITSLCVCAKVFEMLVYEPLLASVSNYISPVQNVFTPKRFTPVSIWHTAIEPVMQVDAIYTDIKAAFDLIPHSKNRRYWGSIDYGMIGILSMVGTHNQCCKMS